jgi:hypothetical protein
MAEENNGLDWKQVKEVIELDREVSYFRNDLDSLQIGEDKEIHPSRYTRIYELLNKLKTSPYSPLYSKTITSLEKIKAGLENVLLNAETLDKELNIPEQEVKQDNLTDDIPF